MKARLFAIILAALLLMAIPVRAGIYYVTVAGLGGEPDYEQEFTQLASNLDKLLKSSNPDAHVYTLTDATRAQMTQVLAKVASAAKPNDDFVLILIGHGTFDGFQYKFNLVGPDITADEIAKLCDQIQSKRQLIVNTTEASGGSVAVLQRRGRAVIAATKDGNEKNATVFARYFVQALHDPEADLDKNNAISAMEAFEYAQRHTADFYDSQKRLATEHAIFEDTGEHQPVRAASTDTGEGLFLSNFTLIRLGSLQEAYNNPAKRTLLAQKEDLERKIDTLKYQKAAMPQDEYKQQLTQALLELAKVQEQLDK
ncbi:MAG TPA: hypothetical protein VNK23_10645 [Candidatus Dormibacteraeota bacterium]|nr:hypothetical protein [Candidatus Dormibacteraeota bacterium]